MATAFTLPGDPEKTQFRFSGLTITEDLQVIFLDGSYDFIVSGSETYLVQFENPTVFGLSFASLNKGDNFFTPRNDQMTQVYLYTTSTAAGALNGKSVNTRPIVIPPKGGPK
jgi:hypothetical protein